MHSIVASASLWTPRRLNPIAWYRADLGITLVGSKVSAWADQSGNGNHLSQSTDALRPAYVASVATRGNCPAVHTIGGTHLSCTITLPREVAFVFALGSVSAGYGISHTYLATATECHYVYSSGPATYYTRPVAGGPSYYRTVNTQPAFVADTNTIFQYDGSAITVRRSGADVVMSAPAGAPFGSEDISGTLRVSANGAGGGGASLQFLELVLVPASALVGQLPALDAYFARLGRPN